MSTIRPLEILAANGHSEFLATQAREGEAEVARLRQALLEAQQHLERNRPCIALRVIDAALGQ